MASCWNQFGEGLIKDPFKQGDGLKTVSWSAYEPADLLKIYQSSVPEMDYSFHVYASKPEQRAIIINGRRLKQGQSVQKGLVLKLITENGVVFHYKGRYFHVDVIEKW